MELEHGEREGWKDSSSLSLVHAESSETPSEFSWQGLTWPCRAYSAAGPCQKLFQRLLCPRLLHPLAWCWLWHSAELVQLMENCPGAFCDPGLAEMAGVVGKEWPKGHSGGRNRREGTVVKEWGTAWSCTPTSGIHVGVC